MEDKNEKNIKDRDLSEENLDYLANNAIDNNVENSINNRQENLFISEKEADDNAKAEIQKKEVSKTEIQEGLKTEDNPKAEIQKKEVSKTEIQEELTPNEINKDLDKKNSEKKVIKTNSDSNKIPIEKSNKITKETLDIKPKVKPKKEIPIEKKPFSEFINEHLIPEIINEFKNRGKTIDLINIKKTNRPISGDICWVIYCEVQNTCNFWLSFEKDDITSLKSFSLCKKYEKPSIIESFLIDEKKITLKLIISRILQRLNGQKLIGAN